MGRKALGHSNRQNALQIPYIGTADERALLCTGEDSICVKTEQVIFLKRNRALQRCVPLGQRCCIEQSLSVELLCLRKYAVATPTFKSSGAGLIISVEPAGMATGDLRKLGIDTQQGKTVFTEGNICQRRTERNGIGHEKTSFPVSICTDKKELQILKKRFTFTK